MIIPKKRVCIENEINILKKKLNNLVVIKDINEYEVIKLSKEIDKLIVQYYHSRT